MTARPQDDEDVARYLRDHPEFFDAHPELLSSISVTHRHGGRAMTHASDLDLVFLFTGHHETLSDGTKPLPAATYFNRLAARLVTALRSSGKTSGSWGEQQLANTLEMAGLRAGIDFTLQTHMPGDGGGKQIAAKTPQALAKRPGRSHTGRALQDFLEDRWETTLQESHDGP